MTNGAGETTTASVELTVTPDAEAVTFFDDSDRPDVVTEEDPGAVELGLRFQADVDGTVTAIRFFRDPENEGAHPVTLWSEDGDVLARGQATGTADGWQQVALDRPVTFRAGDVGVASYHAPQGHYSVDEGYFADRIDSGPISTDADAGIYAYGGAGSFPDSTYQSSNYWIDVVFTPSEPERAAAEAAAAPQLSDDVLAAPLAEMPELEADSGSSQAEEADVTNDQFAFIPLDAAEGEKLAADTEILQGGRHAVHPVQHQLASLDGDRQLPADLWWHDESAPHNLEW